MVIDDKEEEKVETKKIITLFSGWKDLMRATMKLVNGELDSIDTIMLYLVKCTENFLIKLN